MGYREQLSASGELLPLENPSQIGVLHGLVKSINEFWLRKVKLPQQMVSR